MDQFLWGLFAGGLIAYLAYRAGALSKDGAIAAGILGTVVFGLGGWPGRWSCALFTTPPAGFPAYEIRS